MVEKGFQEEKNRLVKICVIYFLAVWILYSQKITGIRIIIFGGRRIPTLENSTGKIPPAENSTYGQIGHTSKTKYLKIDFSFDSAHSISFMQI